MSRVLCSTDRPFRYLYGRSDVKEFGLSRVNVERVNLPDSWSICYKFSKKCSNFLDEVTWNYKTKRLTLYL